MADDPTTTPGTPDLSLAISKLMAHPEILEMASSVLHAPEEQAEAPKKSAAPGDDPQKEAEKAAAKPASADSALPELFSLLSPLLKRRGSDKGFDGAALRKGIALLLALKPYLSPSRCETVDKLVQFGKIGEVLEKLR